MGEAQYSLFWESHKNNICNGLSSLQQNGQFVDMTLAADGHFVKVHQVIIALASPYLRDILSSIDSKHPVIFLNNISYSVLCSILEYIYTGEAVIPLENLTEVVLAGKHLCVKGIENVDLNSEQSPATNLNVEYLEDADGDNSYVQKVKELSFVDAAVSADNEQMQFELAEEDQENKYREEYSGVTEEDADLNITNENKNVRKVTVADGHEGKTAMQYTVSNQGSLQMVLNRFIYYLKHTNKSGVRQWRCVDYVCSPKCPASVVTRGDMVIRRNKPHNHAFHDAKILKKLKNGAIYTEVKTAEQSGDSIKKKSKSESTIS